MTSISLDEMPTLTLLYKLKKIKVPDAKASYEPSAALNDKISVIRQDITTLAVDAIVNAANNSLLGGGGVDGAIHRAAGPKLVEECETLDGCDTGSAKITDGYELPSKKVIHSVGPIYWKEGASRSAELLSGCYRTSLELAVDNECRSIAFSALSTGVYGYPSGEASLVALETVRKFLQEEGKAEKLDRVIFCNFLPKDEDAYFKNIPNFFPPVTYEADAQADQSTEPSELASQLPDAPKTEPNDSETSQQPLSKKQKTTESDDFVLVEKEDVKEDDPK
ncbi:MACRO domain containing protein 1 [Pyrenophora tritici-repentis]|uniref:MACRO domain containing protein n=2 Tax=Pyrenophora tritici-repentis TaxID=45151 RepID=A0A2W1FXF9_9PLEO|nr:MACRO domain containing protein 1 [Pyrenophora tritici-repentis Pt-1C-BFP]KAA8611558.1 MACRO domain-containing protein 1 [Pyrenophora tritici-repentis]EDU48172.1 MACRO domain containing protein 1 [Pyrenophora tritici-repentis Pt-1C-BFP]KAF7447543.1 MACRO domain containing protein [Pyrenophora tritici-repentis]KAF7569924.1 MACRO domain containing protein 1 [Pyrenophora tritici-repentis]KAG9382365.1 MACRO domain containing protein 1 [Pyrenophora tritici-repentis]